MGRRGPGPNAMQDIDPGRASEPVATTRPPRRRRRQPRQGPLGIGRHAQEPTTHKLSHPTRTMGRSPHDIIPQAEFPPKDSETNLIPPARKDETQRNSRNSIS